MTFLLHLATYTFDFSGESPQAVLRCFQHFLRWTTFHHALDLLTDPCCFNSGILVQHGVIGTLDFPKQRPKDSIALDDLVEKCLEHLELTGGKKKKKKCGYKDQRFSMKLQNLDHNLNGCPQKKHFTSARCFCDARKMFQIENPLFFSHSKNDPPLQRDRCRSSKTRLPRSEHLEENQKKVEKMSPAWDINLDSLGLLF